MKCSRSGSMLVLGEKFRGECSTRRPALPQQFEAVEKRFYELKRRLQGGEMDQAVYEERQREDPPARGEPAGKAHIHDLVGPSTRNHMVYLMATTTGDRGTIQDLFVQIAQGIEYRQ